jgi:2,4-dienoyl-CoA reductase-like NADH-dependent reductase (Old Yellow Enzyme family)
MTDRYPNVFREIDIGPVRVKNRLYMPPHGIHLLSAPGPHGSMVHSDDYVHYLAERAAGGVGLLNMSLTVFPRLRQPSPLYPESIPDFRAVADRVHEHGAKLMGQLHYAPSPTIPWEPLGAMVPVIGPSDSQVLEGFHTAYALSRADIRELVKAYGQCTANLREAGVDGVMIHVSHGTLLNKFVSPHYNQRDDEYGGDATGRLRMLVEVLTAVRENGGSGMAVGIRLNVDELLPDGLGQDGSRAMLRDLADLDLLDYADLDIAVEPDQVHMMSAPMFEQLHHIAPYAKSVGEAVRGRVVVMAAGGRVTTLAQAEELLADGALDLVGAVRELIAEPELVKNALEGHEERSRTCIATNFCLRGPSMGRPGMWGCVLNPASGRERRWGTRTFAPSQASRRVVVVGGGPAGMEAARVAAKLGHGVTLLERKDGLGGQLRLWAELPRRAVVREAIAWYARELADADVTIGLGQEATAESILAHAPDVVFLATGSRYDPQGHAGLSLAGFRPIDGWDRETVFTPEAILEGGRRPTGRVLILDDDRRAHTGVGIAELLASAGAEVEIVSRDHTPLGDALMGSFDHHYLLPTLRELGVKLTPSTYLRAIGDGHATVFDIHTGAEERREVDAVVLVSMRRSSSRVESELEGRVERVYTIGDALGARSLFEATYEGHRFARLIDDDAAPRTTGEAILRPIPAANEVPGRARDVTLEARS